MIVFVITLLGLLFLTIIIQLLTKMKIVGGNELGIVSGKGSKKGFRSLSGGRAFIIPLLNKFAKLNLTPHTIEVTVDSAIAAGVVPLNVKATVSFAIASNETGRMRAVTRILTLAEDANPEWYIWGAIGAPFAPTSSVRCSTRTSRCSRSCSSTRRATPLRRSNASTTSSSSRVTPTNNRRSSATSSRRVESRATRTRSSPRAASWTAYSWPMPAVAPVIREVLMAPAFQDRPTGREPVRAQDHRQAAVRLRKRRIDPKRLAQLGG